MLLTQKFRWPFYVPMLVARHPKAKQSETLAFDPELTDLQREAR